MVNASPTSAAGGPAALLLSAVADTDATTTTTGGGGGGSLARSPAASQSQQVSQSQTASAAAAAARSRSTSKNTSSGGGTSSAIVGSSAWYRQQNQNQQDQHRKKDEETPSAVETLGPLPVHFDRDTVESTPTYRAWKELPARGTMAYRNRTFQKAPWRPVAVVVAAAASGEEDMEEERLVRRIWLFRKKDAADGAKKRRREVQQRQGAVTEAAAGKRKRSADVGAGEENTDAEEGPPPPPTRPNPAIPTPLTTMDSLMVASAMASWKRSLPPPPPTPSIPTSASEIDWDSAASLERQLKNRKQKLSSPPGGSLGVGDAAGGTQHRTEDLLTREEIRIFNHLFAAVSYPIEGNPDEVTLPRKKGQGGAAPVFVKIPIRRGKVEHKRKTVAEIMWLVERMCLEAEVSVESVAMGLAKDVVGMKVERQSKTRPPRPVPLKRSEDGTKSVYVRALSDGAREFLAAHGVRTGPQLLRTDGETVRRIAGGYVAWVTERGSRYEGKGPPSQKAAMEKIWKWKGVLKRFAKKEGLDPLAAEEEEEATTEDCGGSGRELGGSNVTVEGEDETAAAAGDVVENGTPREGEEEGGGIMEGRETLITDDAVFVGTADWVQQRATKLQKKK